MVYWDKSYKRMFIPSKKVSLMRDGQSLEMDYSMDGPDIQLTGYPLFDLAIRPGMR